jgi:hypothetical protein
MKPPVRAAIRAAMIGSTLTLLAVSGCGVGSASADPAAMIDGAASTLAQFLADFARQALAAYLL